MRGDILVQQRMPQGEYLEIVLEESGGTRLVGCLDFHVGSACPVQVRHYRIDCQERGEIKHHTVDSIADALDLFRVLSRKLLTLQKEEEQA